MINNLTIAIIALVVNLLVLIIVGLVAFIGKGTHKRIDTLKKDMEKYQTEKICGIYRKKMESDINGIGKFVRQGHGSA